MERGSAKHGPGLDDRIKQRTEQMERGAPSEGRIEEGRAEEGWADDERPVGAVASEPTDIELRADIARYLERVIFPAARDRLVDDAVSRQAPTAVISALEGLP